jgi:hypothetical protein
MVAAISMAERQPNGFYRFLEGGVWNPDRSAQMTEPAGVIAAASAGVLPTALTQVYRK